MIALIDGDPFLYQAYWHQMVFYKKQIKELDELLKHEFINEKEYSIKLAIIDNNFKTIGFNKAKEEIDKLLTGILEANFTDEYVIAVGGPNNFRQLLYPEYKNSSTRSGVRNNKPVWFDELKDYLISKENVVLTDGYEADDLLRIWAIECQNNGKDYVVCSIDKDLDCIEGKHFVNIHSTKGAHSYTITKEEANYFYWIQVLMGDNIDNIPGIKGCGPKSARKILDAVDPEDYEKAVCKAYYKAYKDDGYEHMLLNGRLIHIWRTMNDHFKISKEKFYEAIK